jgi:hypothetical protein
MKSMTSVQFASRMYEVRAKKEYNDCLKENDVKENKDAYLENNHILYYDNYFKVN